MLANLNDLLNPALDGGYAVGCFNVFGYEDARAVVSAAERREASVILSVNLDFAAFMPLEQIAGMLRPLAVNADTPVGLHLDHHYDLAPVHRAIDLGFSSVMYDGSQLAIEDNIAGISEASMHAHERGATVEAEVGSVPYASGRDHIKSALTDIDEAQSMLEHGKPDALAISVGNVHRIEGDPVTIDFERLAALESALDVPLVIHGTSGIRDVDIERMARGQVCKFNIGTCLRQRFGSALRDTLNRNSAMFDRLTIMREVIPEMEDEAARMIELLGQ